MAGPTGRRGERKAALIAAARALFSEHAYSAVTVREIAELADCDAGLISYYFGSKIGLFREAMALPGDPIDSIVAAFGNGGPGAGQRVVATVLNLYENAAVDSNFRLYVANLLTKDENYDSFMSYLQDDLIRKIAARVPGKDALLRTQLAFGEVLGLLYARYLFGKDPLASTPSETVAARYGALIDHTLYGQG